MSIAVSLIAGPNNPEPVTTVFPDKGGVIGRSSGCNLVIKDDNRSVSKRHAFVERVGDQLYLTDLSTNGTFQFGTAEKIGRGVTVEVDDGARIQCADFTLELKLSDEPVQTTKQAAEETPAAAPPAAPQVEAGDPQAIVNGLLAGLELDAQQLDLSDPEAFGRRTGELLRHGLATVALAMRMRAHLKGSMHADVTQLMPSQPNPLKISLNEVDALEAVLGPAHGQFQAPAAALRDIQDELREHELAILKAVRSAMHKVLAELDPQALEERAADAAKGPWPGSKQKKSWELYAEAHAAMNDDDRLDTLFGNCYSQQLQE